MRKWRARAKVALAGKAVITKANKFRADYILQDRHRRLISLHGGLGAAVSSWHGFNEYGLKQVDKRTQASGDVAARGIDDVNAGCRTVPFLQDLH